MFQGCFIGVSGVFQECVMGVSEMSQLVYIGVTGMVYRCYTSVTKNFLVLQRFFILLRTFSKNLHIFVRLFILLNMYAFSCILLLICVYVWIHFSTCAHFSKKLPNFQALSNFLCCLSSYQFNNFFTKLSYLFITHFTISFHFWTIH